MNILDPKYAVQRVKQDIGMLLLIIAAVILCVVLVTIVSVYAGTHMGTQYPTMQNYSATPSYIGGFHDHRL